MAINFTSEEGLSLLGDEALVNFQLFESFVAQENVFFCGVAALKTIYNAENLSRNGSIESYVLFDEAIDSVRPYKEMTGEQSSHYIGFSRNDFERVASKLFSDVNLVSDELLTSRIFQKELADSFIDYHLVINFCGNTLGLKTRGHFAVLGAWNPTSKMILLLDPARHLNGWFWVGLNEIVQAMTIRIQGTSFVRGYIKIKKNSLC